MFDLSGIGGFMAGVTGLNWAPNISAPSTGDYQNLSSLFSTTIGPQGLQGLPGASASISANYSGYVGGEGSYTINNQAPIYGTVYNKVPVYAYNAHSLNSFGAPQLIMEKPTDSTSTSTSSEDVGINNQTWNTSVDKSVTQETDGTHRPHHRHHHQEGASKDLEGTDASGKKTEYTKSYSEIMKASDANKDGILSGDELKNVKLWKDTHHDGTVHAEDLKSAADLNVAEVNLGNGSVITKDLAGYRTVASQQCIGYFGANIYGSSGGSSVGFNFTPTQPSTSVQENLTGLGSYDGGWGSGITGYPGSWGSNSTTQTGNQSFWSGNEVAEGQQAHHHHGHHGHHGEVESTESEGTSEVANAATSSATSTATGTEATTSSATSTATGTEATTATPGTQTESRYASIDLTNYQPPVAANGLGAYQYTNSLGFGGGGYQYSGYLAATGWAVGAGSIAPPMSNSYTNAWNAFRPGGGAA